MQHATWKMQHATCNMQQQQQQNEGNTMRKQKYIYINILYTVASYATILPLALKKRAKVQDQHLRMVHLPLFCHKYGRCKLDDVKLLFLLMGHAQKCGTSSMAWCTNHKPPPCTHPYGMKSHQNNQNTTHNWHQFLPGGSTDMDEAANCHLISLQFKIMPTSQCDGFEQKQLDTPYIP